MKAFVLRSLIFGSLLLATVIGILWVFGGNVDYFYRKFTSPKTQSMIIGDSRGFQGLQPSVLDTGLTDSQYSVPVLNYCFTIGQAKIGPLYNRSIMKKLTPDSENGLFIIVVSPWMFATENDNDPAAGEFSEAGQPPHNMRIVDQDPNLEYLFRNYDRFHFRSIFKQTSELHEDGWLEEKNLPSDPLVFSQWKQNQIELFEGLTESTYPSEFRKAWLDTIVSNLQSRGTVFLIRTPIDMEIQQIENSYFPEFNSFVNSVANKYGLAYFNFCVEEFQSRFETYDGHHIDKFGGVSFSKIVADSISANVK